MLITILFIYYTSNHVSQDNYLLSTIDLLSMFVSMTTAYKLKYGLASQSLAAPPMTSSGTLVLRRGRSQRQTRKLLMFNLQIIRLVTVICPNKKRFAVCRTGILKAYIMCPISRKSDTCHTILEKTKEKVMTS